MKWFSTFHLSELGGKHNLSSNISTDLNCDVASPASITPNHGVIANSILVMIKNRLIVGRTRSGFSQVSTYFTLFRDKTEQLGISQRKDAMPAE